MAEPRVSLSKKQLETPVVGWVLLRPPLQMAVAHVQSFEASCGAGGKGGCEHPPYVLLRRHLDTGRLRLRALRSSPSETERECEE
jgi:hypothetical protein